MSSEHSSFTSDLRSTAQDYKRDAARKHKWALGAVESSGHVDNKVVRPQRPRETLFNSERRFANESMRHRSQGAKGEKFARKQDMLEGNALSGCDDVDSSSSASSDAGGPAIASERAAVSGPDGECDGIMYSFDAPRAPSEGSQILNVALAKAVERFEERETVKLVSAEYDVLDTSGEVVAVPSAAGRRARKGKGKGSSPVMAATVAADVADADEDYEFV